MRKLLLMALMIAMTGCGGKGGGGGHTPVPPPGVPGVDGYTPVAQAIITISRTEDSVAMKSLKMLSPIQVAYAATASVNVTYTSLEATTFTINTASLVPALSGDTLDLGTISVSAIDANKLKVCGPSNNQKCTEAIIRIYTQELVAHPGIGGFVNVTDGYGVDVYAGKTTADELVGLTSLNAAIVQSYTIPNNDNRLTLSDFPTPTYLAEVDFSNAGAGDYEMTLVVELAVRIP